jgi:hypothetical protein
MAVRATSPVAIAPGLWPPEGHVPDLTASTQGSINVVARTAKR